MLIAIPLGIYQAVRRNTIGDHVYHQLRLRHLRDADFFLDLILIQLFALTFPIFSYEASQSTSVIAVIADWHAMTLPIVSLTLLTVAGYSRYMRSVGDGRAGRRTTSRRPGPRACPNGWSCGGTCCATPACRWSP